MMEEDADELMTYFNHLIDLGYGFRHALGMLSRHPSAKVWQAGLDALQSLDHRPVDAWAFLLLCVNRRPGAVQTLSEQALTCVMGQLKNASVEEIEQSSKAIEEVLNTASRLPD